MRKKAKRVDEARATASVVAEQAEQARLCPCGCEAKLGKKRVFEQGHDARIRGWFVAVAGGEKEIGSLPPVLQTAFPLWQGNGAGAFVKAAVAAAMAN